jgi:hypothetical protein
VISRTITKETLTTKVSETRMESFYRFFGMSTLLSNFHVLYSHGMTCINIVNSNFYLKGILENE